MPSRKCWVCKENVTADMESVEEEQATSDGTETTWRTVTRHVECEAPVPEPVEEEAV